MGTRLLWKFRSAKADTCACLSFGVKVVPLLSFVLRTLATFCELFCVPYLNGLWSASGRFRLPLETSLLCWPALVAVSVFFSVLGCLLRHACVLPPFNRAATAPMNTLPYELHHSCQKS